MTNTANITKNYKIKGLDERWFNLCKSKVEMYIRTGNELNLPQYQHPTLSEYNGKITFWNDCEDVLCFDDESREANVKALVFWLLNGAVDPLGHYGVRK